MKDEQVRKAGMRLFRTVKIGLIFLIIITDKLNPAKYGKNYVFFIFPQNTHLIPVYILYLSRRQGGLFYHVSTNDNSIVFRVSPGVIMMDFHDRINWMLYVIFFEQIEKTRGGRRHRLYPQTCWQGQHADRTS